MGLRSKCRGNERSFITMERHSKQWRKWFDLDAYLKRVFIQDYILGKNQRVQLEMEALIDSVEL